MKALEIIKNLKPIEGFKVMEWVRAVREKEYELYKRDPEEYFRQLRKAGKKMRERASKAEKNLG
ncbi:MAG: hypothetical protein BGO68_03845 [Candidatus Amoebophilus sp. 36-38]|nr:MAG: hypothetical protein BGO68_03845 [Candidatus Amoebophilus sp. 36-38]